MFLSRMTSVAVLTAVLSAVFTSSAAAQTYDGHHLYRLADVSLDKAPSNSKRVYKLEGIVENSNAIGTSQKFCSRMVLQYRKGGRWRKSAKVDAVQSCSNHPDGSGWLSQFITVRRSIVRTYPYRVKFSFRLYNFTIGHEDQGYLTYDLP